MLLDLIWYKKLGMIIDKKLRIDFGENWPRIWDNWLTMQTSQEKEHFCLSQARVS